MTIIGLITHGCAKNLVDTELMAGFLNKAGYKTTLDESKADIVIVNTCSFIHDSEKESIQSILKLINENKKVIITGCLPQKHKKELKEAIPEALALIGTTKYSKIVEVVKKLENKKFVYEVEENPQFEYTENVSRTQITMGSSSYIKIADGCNASCGYCIIPSLRGKYHSRSIENIVAEAEKMAKNGVSEIILIAQDTSYYGMDLYKKLMLPQLLRKLNQIQELNWIRIMYLYPAYITDELLETINDCKKVVKYFDIPLQHYDLELLKLMKRPQIDGLELVKKIRQKVKNACIRTTIIVGYPSETQEQFNNLKNFVKNAKFDRLGVFEFSKEKGTFAYNLKPQITSKIKKQRKKEIMQIQQQISLKINKNLIGKEIDCIIEAIYKNGDIIARSYKDAPEIDGFVYVKTDKQLIVGDIEKIKIINANEYDLFGVFGNYSKKKF